MLKRTRWWTVGCALALTSCVRVASNVTYSRTLVSTKQSVETLAGSLALVASRPAVRGSELTVRVESRERCRYTATPIYNKRAYESRTAAPGSMRPLYSLGFGALGLAAGGYSYARADMLAAADSSADPSTPAEYRNAGIVTASLGTVMLVVAAIDAMRLADEEWDAGREHGEPDVREASCRRAPLARAAVIASRDGWRAQATTDARGGVTFALYELPEDAFASGALTLQIASDEASTELALDSTQTTALLETLASEPASRIARDRTARAEAACHAARSAALARAVDATTTDDELAAATASWRAAKTTCGTRWTADDERARTAFEARLAATAAERIAHACQAAGTAAHHALEADDESDPATLRTTLVATCDGANNARSVVDAFDRTRREHERRAAARARLVEGATRVDALVEQNDAQAIAATLRTYPELLPLLRRSETMRGELVRIATHWIGVLERDLGARTALRQVCASRGLVTSHVGRGAWASLRIAAVKRSSVTNGTRIARLLDGGACS